MLDSFFDSLTAKQPIQGRVLRTTVNTPGQTHADAPQLCRQALQNLEVAACIMLDAATVSHTWFSETQHCRLSWTVGAQLQHFKDSVTTWPNYQKMAGVRCLVIVSFAA